MRSGTSENLNGCSNHASTGIFAPLNREALPMRGQEKTKKLAAVALILLAAGFFWIGPGQRQPAQAALVVPSQVAEANDGQPASVADIRGLAGALRQSRSAILNLRVDYTASSGPATEQGAFISVSNTSAGTAWFSGIHRAMERVLVKKSLTKWDGGPARQLEESYDYGFDGVIGKKAQYSDGPLGGAALETPACRIFSNRPAEMSEERRDYETGVGFTTYMGHKYPTGALDEILDRVADSDRTRVFLSSERRGGVDVRVLRMVGPIGKPSCVTEYTFDPSRGCALISFVYAARCRDGTTVSQRETILSLQKVCDSVWFPTSATRETRSGTHIERIEFASPTIIANAPGADDKIYEVPFPSPCRLIDERVGASRQAAGL
jgi:hypothetical protein